ncbi:DUF3618 domain-containing protein [Corynebacterium marinum]|uniref:DUF3618 domain-containing protein n=1 Tax=Corynebacterium marinum DSM 44953 TaxID=1224162 RepID=A0A0B6TNW9_9CORY|nr:DUF3618 domain-containing protein [Corynebacterium marinum]AJK69623.1 hypothetical protein B840_10195 [Corynebacterium marinum DSM 44953]GGO22738.1 hypothetical protein GCM10010980_25080 [Corynebacterium marinum]
MSNNPDEIRADIERTRGNLGRDVDALAEKVDPGRVVDRQADRLKSRWRDMRESVFGSEEDDAQPTGQGRASQLPGEAGDAARNAPDTIRRKTRGNPLAAGAIALAAGWLVGSLLPASRQEQEAAAAVRDKAQPLVEEAKSVAQEMGESLQPQAEQAVTDVQASARESVERVKDEGQHHLADVREDSRSAAENIRDVAREQ